MTPELRLFVEAWERRLAERADFLQVEANELEVAAGAGDEERLARILGLEAVALAVRHVRSTLRDTVEEVR